MEDPLLYPLKFKPILKEKVWGGHKLVHTFHKNGAGILGESWEISGVKGDISVVAEGALKGKTLNELLTIYTSQLVGEQTYKNFGVKFPLLFKFIDAKQDLSVQLHPDDSLAQERHDSFGKTEMWYIMQADSDARLITGMQEGVTKESYQQALDTHTITEILKTEKVVTGDSFFIAPGTVHAIGAGVVLAEIQQTSDITYRIYDWDRPGVDGKMRALHTTEALAAIDYNAPEAKLSFPSKKDAVVQLCSVPYFETNRLILTKTYERDLSAIDCFVVYMCVEGETTITTPLGTIAIKMGETILLPAICKNAIFKTENATLLEVYIPF